MDATKFFNAVRQHPFNGSISQVQVDGVNELVKAGASLIPPQLAYVLATAYHETAATMYPIAEYGHGAGHPYGAVDQTGKAPYGRGYVQLTHRDNYVKADAELGLGGKLASNYDLALDPTIAAKIIIRGMAEGWFTTKKLNDYITPDQHDFYDARRIVNGLDKAQLIAGYAEQFLAALVAASAIADPFPAPIPATPAKPVPPPIPAPQLNPLEKAQMFGTILSLVFRLAPAVSAVEPDFAADLQTIASNPDGQAKLKAFVAAIKDILAVAEALII